MLKERDSNFQKVTFEQRVKRGWKAYLANCKKSHGEELSPNKKHKADIPKDKSHEEDNSKEDFLKKDYLNDESYINSSNDLKFNETEQDGSFKTSKNNKNSEKGIKDMYKVSAESRFAESYDDLHTCPMPGEVSSKKRTNNDDINGDDTIIKKSKSSEPVSKPVFYNDNNKKVKFDKTEVRTLKEPLYGCVVSKYISHDKNLHCSFSSISQRHTKGSVAKQFVYVTDPPSKNSSNKKFTFMHPQLKETKLHASRTSLIIHRNLTDEQPIPTNAMNTHDSLMINPLKMNLHLKSSPYRMLKLKIPITPDQKLLWQRFSEHSEPDFEGKVIIQSNCSAFFLFGLYCIIFIKAQKKKFLTI